MLPIYSLCRLQTYVHKINAVENDFDPHLCLWFNGATQYGNLTSNISGTAINPTFCYLAFTPPITDYYTVAFAVEDFETSISLLFSYFSCLQFH
jgi:hypothetical protein